MSVPNRWTAEVVAPSGRYGFISHPASDREPHGPVVQVVQRVSRPEPHWGPTPARFYASDTPHRPGARLAIDAGAGWSLDEADTAALAEYSAAVLAGTAASQGAPALLEVDQAVSYRHPGEPDAVGVIVEVNPARAYGGLFYAVELDEGGTVEARPGEVTPVPTVAARPVLIAIDADCPGCGKPERSFDPARGVFGCSSLGGGPCGYESTERDR